MDIMDDLIHTDPLLPDAEPMFSNADSLLPDEEPLLSNTEPLFSDRDSLLEDTDPQFEDTMTTGARESDQAQDPAISQVLARADKEELPVEEAFAALESLVAKMEEDGISLEASFACYQAGIRLVRYCNERIDRVEKKVQILRGEGEAPLEAE